MGGTVGRTSVWLTSRMHDRATNGLGRTYIHELASTSLQHRRLMTASVRHARPQQTRQSCVSPCVTCAGRLPATLAGVRRGCVWTCHAPCLLRHAIATGVAAEASRHRCITPPFPTQPEVSAPPRLVVQWLGPGSNTHCLANAARANRSTLIRCLDQHALSSLHHASSTGCAT